MKAANLGSKVAQSNLALCYEYGSGVTKDLEKAKYWKEKSEEKE